MVSCGNSETTQNTSKTEEEELAKVDSMVKTDKQKEDSVLAKWKEKAENSKIEDE